MSRTTRILFPTNILDNLRIHGYDSLCVVYEDYEDGTQLLYRLGWYQKKQDKSDTLINIRTFVSNVKPVAKLYHSVIYGKSVIYFFIPLQGGECNSFCGFVEIYNKTTNSVQIIYAKSTEPINPYNVNKADGASTADVTIMLPSNTPLTDRTDAADISDTTTDDIDDHPTLSSIINELINKKRTREDDGNDNAAAAAAAADDEDYGDVNLSKKIKGCTIVMKEPDPPRCSKNSHEINIKWDNYYYHTYNTSGWQNNITTKPYTLLWINEYHYLRCEKITGVCLDTVCPTVYDAVTLPHTLLIHEINLIETLTTHLSKINTFGHTTEYRKLLESIPFCDRETFQRTIISKSIGLHLSVKEFQLIILTALQKYMHNQWGATQIGFYDIDRKQRVTLVLDNLWNNFIKPENMVCPLNSIGLVAPHAFTDLLKKVTSCTTNEDCNGERILSGPCSGAGEGKIYAITRIIIANNSRKVLSIDHAYDSTKLKESRHIRNLEKNDIYSQYTKLIDHLNDNKHLFKSTNNILQLEEAFNKLYGIALNRSITIIYINFKNIVIISDLLPNAYLHTYNTLYGTAFLQQDTFEKYCQFSEVK